jgi:CRISPR/Cas system-associated exonuclease Cas4 (RecB family)
MLQRMDSLIRGSLFHRAAFETTRQLMKAGGFPLKDENLPGAFNILDEALRGASAEYAARYSPAIPEIWQKEVALIRADLRGWLQGMAADHAWQPVAAELAFGRPFDDDHDPRSSASFVQVLGEFNVLGSIDLIERNFNGSHRVTDYKTGRVPYPQPRAVGGGAYLQPLIYALAAEAVLGQPVDGGRLHYATMRGAYKAIFISLSEENKRLLFKVLDGIDRSVRSGFLPAAPLKGACANCDYLSICGPNEEDRTKTKSQVELKILSQIRGLK